LICIGKGGPGLVPGILPCPRVRRRPTRDMRTTKTIKPPMEPPTIAATLGPELDGALTLGQVLAVPGTSPGAPVGSGED
jgi:hypothetical protein